MRETTRRTGSGLGMGGRLLGGQDGGGRAAVGLKADDVARPAGAGGKVPAQVADVARRAGGAGGGLELGRARDDAKRAPVLRLRAVGRRDEQGKALVAGAAGGPELGPAVTAREDPSAL